MKKVLILFASLSLLFSCTSGKVAPSVIHEDQEKEEPTPTPTPDGGKDETITVDSRCVKGANTLNLATYNVGVFNKSGTNSMEMISKMMKEWDLDALSLNELDSCNTRSGINVYQLKDFAGVMGKWNYNFAGAISYKNGKYGIGVATPYEIKSKWALSLPNVDDKEKRAVSVVETDKFVFCSCHLGLTENAQLGQIAELEKFMKQHFTGYRKPVFFCGDMNAEPQMETIKKLQENWTVLSTTGDTTFSTSNPVKCIDYIFLYKNAAQVKVKTSFVGKSFKYGDPKTASDHFPVFVQVEL